MLTITIQGDELWDNEAEIFRYTEPVVLQFEHSLASLSKWESKYHKLFLVPTPHTEEEMLGYLQAMLVTPDADPEVLNRLTEEHIRAIDAYINDPMTATTISELPHKRGQTTERLSAELIQFWMDSYGINYECRHWHLNQLFTLIKIHYTKTQKPQKINRQTRIQQMAEENARRRAKTGSHG